MADPWFLKAFTEEAKIRHINSTWDAKTRQIFSAKEAAVDGFLSQDNPLNKTDEPTLPKQVQETHIEFNVPQVADKQTNSRITRIKPSAQSTFMSPTN